MSMIIILMCIISIVNHGMVSTIRLIVMFENFAKIGRGESSLVKFSNITRTINPFTTGALPLTSKIVWR